MKKNFISCLMIYFWSLGFIWAQPPDQDFITNPNISDSALMAKVLGEKEDITLINEKLTKLESIISKHQERFGNTKNKKKVFRYLFNQVHRSFLKNYHNYSPENRFFEKGEYDCVSGSALLAYAFEKAGYKVEIHETPFHAYILIKLDSKDKILLESTSALSGFIDSENLISQLERQYTFANQQTKHPYHPSFNRKVSLRELMGLQMYNHAVWYFNQQKFEVAQQSLEKAHTLYQEDRIAALKQLCMNLLAYPQNSIVQEIKKLDK